MGYPGDEDEVYETAVEGEAYDTGEQLTLSGDDDALPWLATDDDEEDQGGGTDYRILGFAIAALVALGAILWGAKAFFDNAGSSATAEADGSTIAAPEGDYKERPQNPGGQDVAGTGDLSYEVGEGVAREGHLAGEEGPASPSVDLAQRGTAPSPAATGTADPAAASGGVGVQVGAFQTRETAEAGWSTLQGRYPALEGVRHRIVEATVDSGTIYRLQAVAADGAAADAMCRAIRNAGGDCQVKR